MISSHKKNLCPQDPIKGLITTISHSVFRMAFLHSTEIPSVPWSGILHMTWDMVLEKCVWSKETLVYSNLTRHSCGFKFFFFQWIPCYFNPSPALCHSSCNFCPFFTHQVNVHTVDSNSCHPDKKQDAPTKRLSSPMTLSVSRVASLQRCLQYLEAGLLHMKWDMVLEKCVWSKVTLVHCKITWRVCRLKFCLPVDSVLFSSRTLPLLMTNLPLLWESLMRKHLLWYHHIKFMSKTGI